MANLLQCFNRSSMSFTNPIIEEEVRRHAQADKEEVSNRCNSDVNRNSAIDCFKEACLQATEE